MTFDFEWLPLLGARFVYPSAGGLTVLMLESGFRETRLVRYFGESRSTAGLGFAPEVLAGTVAQLRRIAESRPRLKVRNALVVFARNAETRPAEEDRELFWEVFGVPIFEQYLNRRNRLIASECDAHEGLHVRSATAWRPGWHLEKALCPCGDPRPRLMPGRPEAIPGVGRLYEQESRA